MAYKGPVCTRLRDAYRVCFLWRDHKREQNLWMRLLPPEDKQDVSRQLVCRLISAVVYVGFRE